MNDLVAALFWGAIQISVFAAMVAVVVIVARRGLAGVVAPLLASSMMAMILMTAISVLPLPSWLPSIGNFSSATNFQDAALADGAVEPDATHASLELGALPTTSAASSTAEFNWAPALSELFASLKSSPSPDVQTITPTQSQGSYWGWLLGAVLLGAAFVGVSRLLLGLWGLAKLRAGSTEVHDEKVDQSVVEISNRIGMNKGVRVFESTELTTAATIGCWSPVILLPFDWRQWSDAERSSVIAHELAHVDAGDFIRNLISQFAIALNYFNPLVHWLGSELRVAQELAADATASGSSGGRRNYLQTMAEMALKQDTTHLGWLAQPFLPTRKTFLRRIEMLKGEQRLRGIGRYQLHYALQATVFLVAVACIGFRLPGGVATAQSAVPTAGPLANQPAATAETPAPTSTAESGSEDVVAQRLAYVSDQAHFFVAVDLEKIKQFEWGKKLLQAGDEMLAADLTTRLSTATSATFQVFRWADGGSSAGIVIRGADSYKENGDVKPTKFTHRGIECRDFGGTCTYRPDSSTVVFGSHRPALKLMLDAGVDGPQIAKWHRNAGVQLKKPIFAAISQLEMEQHLDKMQWLLTPSFASVMENTELVTLGVGVDAAGITTNLELKAKQGKVAALNRLVLQAVKRTMQSWKDSFADMEGMNLSQADRGKRAVLARSMMIYTYLLGEANVTPSDDKVQISGTKAVTEDVLTQMVQDVLSNANAGAHQARSLNDLRQLALAMFVYESKHQHFPMAANQTEASEFKHSWRIALLPYLDEEELYNRYRLNEAWDSPHNQKVTAKMPDLYRSPSQSANATTSGYYVVTGKGTLFDGSPRSQVDVRDGSANTLLLVEAKRETHWAKPEDIPFAAGEMKRQIASFDGKNIFFARTDGSVSVAPLKSVSAQMLDWFILPADGHEVDFANPRRNSAGSKAADVVPRETN